MLVGAMIAREVPMQSRMCTASATPDSFRGTPDMTGGSGDGG